MDSIGKLAMGIAATNTSARQPCRDVALQPQGGTDKAPPLLNRAADIEMPKLFRGPIIDGESRQISRALYEGERRGLTARAVELRDGLRPHIPDEDALVEAELLAMLGGFRNVKLSGENAAATAANMRTVLGAFPLWAIAKACMRIAGGEAGLDTTWAPNDAQVAQVVRDVVAPYRRTLEIVEQLLAAPVALPAPEPKPMTGAGPAMAHDAMTPKSIPEPKPTPGYAARVAADLAARKARRGSENAA